MNRKFINKVCCWIVMSLCCGSLWGQFLPPDTLINRAWRQSILFPQEKLHLHTDKSAYSAGENIWLRAYVVDAQSNRPMLKSRYVYVELLDPFGKVKERNRLKQDEQGAVYGYVALEDTLPTGTYTLRAYTRYMENAGEEYFFRKPVRIVNTLSRSISITPKWTRDNCLEFRLVNPVNNAPSKVYTTHLYTREGEIPHRRNDNKVTVTLGAAKLRGQYVLVQAGNYKEYIYLPQSIDYAVSFLPEGGSLLNGALSKVAFKALDAEGWGIPITGKVFDDRDSLVTTFKTLHTGMGWFSFIADASRRYYAVCHDYSGKEKTFPLPEVLTQGYGLKVERHRGKIICRILSAEGTRSDSLYLFVHQRGLPKYASLVLSGTTKLFENSAFDSGSLHFKLIDRYWNVLSERMLFILPQENKQLSASVFPDKPLHEAREKITLRVNVQNPDSTKVNGTCSIAVTNNEDVRPDSLNSLLTTLLLTSELKGHIENPSWYFSAPFDAYREEALDLLMLTQGWRCYPLSSKTLRGQMALPTIPFEESMTLSGQVVTRVRRKPVKGTLVGISAPDVNMIEQVVTDSMGKFRLRYFEFPDTTKYLISAFSKKGDDKVVLQMDKEYFPALSDSIAIWEPSCLYSESFLPSPLQNLSKFDMKLFYEEGIRHVFLEEVIIRGSRIFQYDTPTESLATHVRKEKDLDKKKGLNLGMAIGQLMLSGVFFTNGQLYHRGSPLSIRFDDVPLDPATAYQFLNTLPISDIRQVELVPGYLLNGLVGVDMTSYVLCIFTKSGADYGADYSPTNVGVVQLLGYQTPVMFYSPQYDTVKKKKDNKPDLRTTIYWNPVVEVHDGKAEVEFYSADGDVDYTLIGEGLTGDGKIIRVQSVIK